jgi:hypothetical protein
MRSRASGAGLASDRSPVAAERNGSTRRLKSRPPIVVRPLFVSQDSAFALLGITARKFLELVAPRCERVTPRPARRRDDAHGLPRARMPLQDRDGRTRMTDIAELVKELYKYPCSADVERRAARALESQAESLDEAHAGLAITIAQRDQSPPPPPAGPRRGVIAKPPKPAECTCCWCMLEEEIAELKRQLVAVTDRNIPDLAGKFCDERGVIAKPPKPAECTCCWCITEPCPVHAPPTAK